MYFWIQYHTIIQSNGIQMVTAITFLLQEAEYCHNGTNLVARSPAISSKSKVYFVPIGLHSLCRIVEFVGVVLKFHQCSDVPHLLFSPKQRRYYQLNVIKMLFLFCFVQDKQIKVCLSQLYSITNFCSIKWQGALLHVNEMWVHHKVPSVNVFAI